jgi:hypothetical protein
LAQRGQVAVAADPLDPALPDTDRSRRRPAAASGALDYAFDPRDPAPTVGGAIARASLSCMPVPSTDAAALPLMLVFTTPPLDHEPKSPARLRCGYGSPDAPDTGSAAVIDHRQRGFPGTRNDAARLYRDAERRRDGTGRSTIIGCSDRNCSAWRLRSTYRAAISHFDVAQVWRAGSAWQQPRIARNRVFAEAARPRASCCPSFHRASGIA